MKALTEREKELNRFFASVDEIDDYIPRCAVCKYVDGKKCKALKTIRPEKYYMNDDPSFQKCPHLKFDKNSHCAKSYKKIKK